MKREDFINTTQKHAEYHSPHFIAKVYQKPPPSLEGVKMAVVISGKIVKKAVDRNTLKRRVYSLLKECKNGETDKNIVIIAKKGVGNITFSEVKEEIEGLFQKVDN